MIIKVIFAYRQDRSAAGGYVLDISASHAYRDDRGRLITPTHTRQVASHGPKSITEGLRHGVSQLDWLLRSKAAPFEVADHGDLEERAFRLVG